MNDKKKMDKLDTYKDMLESLCCMMHKDGINPELFIKRFCNESLKETNDQEEEEKEIQNYLNTLNEKETLYWQVITDIAYLMSLDDLGFIVMASDSINNIKKS